MSKMKAQHGLEYIANRNYPSEEEKVLASILHRYIETDDKNYWKAARHMAMAINLRHILGHIPHDVQVVINAICEQVYDTARRYYYNLENELGFIPFNVRARVLLDRDDPALNEQIQADNLALTQRNSVERMLTKYYRTGVWNGQEDTVHKAYQKHRAIFLEGCYSREDYY